jgi:DNA-binding NtrC family response regulator
LLNILAAQVMPRMPDQAATVMVLENDKSLLHQLEALIHERGCEPVVVAGAEEALRRFGARPPAAVVLDLTGDGANGIAALAGFKAIDREVPVLVVSGAGEPAMLVQAMRNGASEFLCKPVSPDQLAHSLDRALHQRHVNFELASMRSILASHPPYRLVFSKDSPMAEGARVLERVAETDAPVLVRGEPGTGKELVARSLHAGSMRRAQPFVKVSCSGLSPSVLESEIFGCERGAATGAVQQMPGRLEFANHGTLFLDGVNELAPALQVRLLHALRDGVFTRNGGGSPVLLDARIVSSTCRRLDEAVADDRLSRDLLLRLAVVVIDLPPLRDRGEDLKVLVDYFLTKYCVDYNKPRPRLSDETIRLFAEHSWPGNVAELQNVVRRLVADGSDARVRREIRRAMAQALHACEQAAVPAVPRVDARASETPPAEPGPAAGDPTAHSGSLKEIARAAARAAERTAIARMLQRTRWNRKEAAEILGISYKALLYKIKENGLDKPSPAR